MIENRFSAKITNYQVVENDKVVYFILAQDNIKGGVHTSRFRYSELKSYHDKVKKVLQEFHINSFDLPHFPGKKMFGKTNKNEESIIERKNDIEQYINELISIKKLWSLQILEQIIGPKDPEEQKIDDYLREEDQEKKEFNPPTSSSKVQLGNEYRVNIESFCREEDTIKYFFKFYDMVRFKTWETKFRYSELKGLHESVSKEIKQFKNIKLPQFPKSKIFGITNDDKQDIFNRRDQLQDYINFVIADKHLLKLPVVQYFLQDSHLHSEGNELELRELQLKFLMKKLKMNREQTINIIKESGEKGFKNLRSYIEEYAKIHNTNNSNQTSLQNSKANSVRSSVATLKPIKEDLNQEVMEENTIYYNKLNNSQNLNQKQQQQESNQDSNQQEEQKQQYQSSENVKNVIQYQEVKF